MRSASCMRSAIWRRRPITGTAVRRCVRHGDARSRASPAPRCPRRAARQSGRRPRAGHARRARFRDLRQCPPRARAPGGAPTATPAACRRSPTAAGAATDATAPRSERLARRRRPMAPGTANFGAPRPRRSGSVRCPTASLSPALPRQREHAARPPATAPRPSPCRSSRRRAPGPRRPCRPASTCHSTSSTSAMPSPMSGTFTTSNAHRQCLQYAPQRRARRASGPGK